MNNSVDLLIAEIQQLHDAAKNQIARNATTAIIRTLRPLEGVSCYSAVCRRIIMAWGHPYEWLSFECMIYDQVYADIIKRVAKYFPVSGEVKEDSAC